MSELTDEINRSVLPDWVTGLYSPTQAMNVQTPVKMGSIEALKVIGLGTSGKSLVANFREWITFRFSQTGGAFWIGQNFLDYIQKLSRDDTIKATMMREKPESFQIPAASGDVAYFSAWIMSNIWKEKTFLFYVSQPIEKVYCISHTAGRWYPFYIRNIETYTDDNSFESILEFVAWLRVSPCARKIAWSPMPEDGESIIWFPYDENYFKELERN